MHPLRGPARLQGVAQAGELVGDDAVRMQKILDALEVLDDVQDVYTNAVLPE